jgi:hypothetical protein
MGMNQFDGTKSLLMNSGFDNIDHQYDYWTREDVPYNDSIHIYRMEIKLKRSSCYPGSEGTATLFFADDKFYLIYMTISYSPSNASQGMAYYEQLVSTFVKRYPVKIPHERSSGRSGKKIGEGFYLCKNFNEHNSKKPEEISISYLIKPKVSFSNNYQVMKDEAEIESFDIEIVYKNLKLTKFQ